MNARQTVVLRDPDLHAHLLGPQVLATVSNLRQWMSDQILGQAADESLWLLLQAEEDPASPGHDETIEALYRTCPANLAERLHEALTIYRSLGRTALPPLLPLAHRLLQAELHLYTRLAPGKPYRDHLSHQTRVAALAHLWLSDGAATEHKPTLPLPKGLCWHRLRACWSRTPEFHLLRLHARRHGLACPEPGVSGDDSWSEVVAAAALLAGLCHDMGYVHKALGEVCEPVAHTFDMLCFMPEVRIDDRVDELPMAGLFRRLVAETEHGQKHAPLDDFVSRHYRHLHSVVGAVWLATLDRRLRRDAGSTDRPSGNGWQGELCLQLAAMMALAHDFALADEARRKLLGLRENGQNDVLNVSSFPLCTLFALCDVLQEFGRPIQIVKDSSSSFMVPIPGLALIPVDPEDRSLDEVLWDIKPPSAAPRGLATRDRSREMLSLAFCTRDRSRELLSRAQLGQRISGAGWQEHRVGAKVLQWLKRTGLDKHLVLAGDPDLASRLHLRGLELIGAYRDGGTQQRRQLGFLLKALARLLGVDYDRDYSKLKIALQRLLEPDRTDPTAWISDALPKIAPVRDLRIGKPLTRLARRVLRGRRF